LISEVNFTKIIPWIFGQLTTRAAVIMASPKMWRYLEFFFDKFTLPHYFVKYNKTLRSAKRGGKRDWPFWAFYIGIGYGHVLLLIYYHLAVLWNKDESPLKALRVIFVMLFTSIVVLVTACVYTILLNESRFAKYLSSICRFQTNFEGDVHQIS
jgi:hypothetical protein